MSVDEDIEIELQCYKVVPIEGKQERTYQVFKRDISIVW